MVLYGVSAWAHVTYPYHVNWVDTVSWSDDARVPVNHTSVGVTQARPNHTCTPTVVHYYPVDISLVFSICGTTAEYRVIFNGSYLIAAVTQGNHINTSLYNVQTHK